MALNGLKNVINRYAIEGGDYPGKWNQFGYVLVTDVAEMIDPDGVQDFIDGLQEALGEITSDLPEDGQEF